MRPLDSTETIDDSTEIIDGSTKIIDDSTENIDDSTGIIDDSTEIHILEDARQCLKSMLWFENRREAKKLRTTSAIKSVGLVR